MTVGDYAVADAPELEGLDVPLIALTADKARAMVDAARPMVRTSSTRPLQQPRAGHRALSAAGRVLQRRDRRPRRPEGLKVRASGRMTAKFLEALGAEGVNVAFSEVPGALQKGVVDCAVTGAGSGYSAGWWEVSTHLLPMPLGGWDPVVTAINADKWNSLGADMQELISTEIREKFEDPAWASADGALTNDIACLTGNGTCASGDARSMVLVPATDADMAEARKILETEVLPEWAARAGKDWADRWNKSVGSVLGVSVATN
jgi:hypothetical protein